MFGWDMKRLQDQNMVNFLNISLDTLDQNISELIIENIRNNEIERAVIDSISILATNAPLYKSLNEISVVDIMERKSIFSPPILGDYVVKKFVYNFIDRLRRADHCTILVICEACNSGDYLSRDTVSEFACDGVIKMEHIVLAGGSRRMISIVKMRSTDCETIPHNFEIEKEGIIVKPLKEETI